MVQCYLAQISGPLLDRIDLHSDVPVLAEGLHNQDIGNRLGIAEKTVRDCASPIRQLPHDTDANR
jgi:predicted ATPase with chaperone activity